MSFSKRLHALSDLRRRLTFSSSERPYVLRFTLFFAIVITAWVVIHDVHLMAVEPRHFTEFHREVLPLSNLNLLAVQYALIASLGPAVLYGFLAYFACRTFSFYPVELMKCGCGFILLICLFEYGLLCVGRYAYNQFITTGETLYPKTFYPELSDGIIYTQSVNVSAYLFVPPLAGLYLLLILWYRLKSFRKRAEFQ